MFFYKNQKIKTKNQRHKQNIQKILYFYVCVFNLLFLIFGFSPRALASEISGPKLVELANQERAHHGINPLTADPLLYLAALAKAQDMFSYDYFDHFSPAGRSPWNFIREQGYDYSSAGENLAMDFRTSEGIQKAWMDSATHRENILNPAYQDVGVAAAKGQLDHHSTTLVVQMFAKKNSSILGKVNSLTMRITNLILGYNPLYF